MILVRTLVEMGNSQKLYPSFCYADIGKRERVNSPLLDTQKHSGLLYILSIQLQDKMVGRRSRLFQYE